MTTDGTYRIARILRKLTLGFLLVALCPAAGVLAGDGVVALQTAEASCGAGSPASTVYVDCGNGTVTDRRTGLVWLANADCLGGGVDWYTAMEFVAGLADLDDGFCATESQTAAECDGYVTGLEPATGYPHNRSVERKFGRVPTLQPGKSQSFTLEYTVLLNKNEVKKTADAIKKIQGSRKTKVHPDPVDLD